MIRVMIRELQARWVLVPAAIVVALLAMFAIHSIEHVRGDADGVMTGTWGATLVVSAIVGLSMLGDELTNGRLSFYFARPFSPAAIFGGKLAAGVVLALVMQAAVIAFVAYGLPALAWQGSALAERGAVAVAGERVLATVAATILGMAASIAIGSKSKWYVVDLACVAIVGVITTWGVLVVADEPYSSRVSALQIGVLALVVAALAFATARALARGRTDRIAAHATLSRTLWPVVIPAAIVFVLAMI